MFADSFENIKADVSVWHPDILPNDSQKSLTILQIELYL